MRTLILTVLKGELKSIKYMNTFGKECGKLEAILQGLTNSFRPTLPAFTPSSPIIAKSPLALTEILYFFHSHPVSQK